MRRIISYFIITLLLFMTVAPCFGHKYFNAYAEETSEQLTDDQKLEAGLAVYLNSRNGYITGSVDAVKALMLSLIHTEEFWENTTVGSIAEVYAGIIIKYSPFRVSLKGSAVRAFNDLYNYLKDNDKIPNAADSDGGETTDNLYDGLLYGDSLFYIINDDPIYNQNNFICTVSNPSKVVLGNAYGGYNWEYLLNYYNSNYAGNNAPPDFDSNNWSSRQSTSLNIQLPKQNTNSPQNNYDTSMSVSYYYEGDYGPLLRLSRLTITGNDYATLLNKSIYSNRVNKVRGSVCLAKINYTNNPSEIYAGIITYDSHEKKYIFSSMYKYNNPPANTENANINLDTDDFQKQDPPVPEGDDEVEYTPKDKDTGNTYNTYNEYINNYVIKKTIINKEEVTPSPGGTVPDWGDSGSGSGTITPGEGNTYNFNLPDFELPDLNIDWNISGLGEKFPFSIPFDLIAFFTVLNAEPETPAVQGQIDLKIVQWDIDWDLSQFDSLARILRNLEFIGFCIALILITRRIIKG